LTSSGTVFDLQEIEYQIKSLEKTALQESFWNDPAKARAILKQKNNLEQKQMQWQVPMSAFLDLEALLSLAMEEKDDSLSDEITAEIESLDKVVNTCELKMMLRNEEDAMNAIMSIHAGAGGTESQDWTDMLLRMYLRWAEKRAFKTEIIDYLAGDEAGVKSVSFTLEGDYAYGYAKAEIGIHRLVRISPFDANSRRHTSFASVFVYPEVDDDIEIDIEEKDLRIDTYRSTGAGGQHVNKTDSAVRITHIPTGIVVQCQNERSQHKNKSMAMKYLRSRLYERKLQEKAEQLDQIEKSKKDIAWGSQIRSYVLHPYKMIKDHRTNLEIGNANRVLDGDLDELINAYLMMNSSE
jgi:peptide chain release factor 2